MIENPEGFQAEAVESAKYVINQRNKGDEDFQEKIPKYLVQEEKESGFLSKLNTSVKSIAIYQIISSLLILPSLVSLNYSTVLFAAISISFLVIYLLGIIGGVLLLKKKEKGFFLSKLFNAFQTILITLGGISYTCVGLITLYLQVKFIEGFHFSFGFYLGSNASLYFHDSNEFMMGINFVSLFDLILLIKAHDSLEESDSFDDHLLNKNLNSPE